MTRPAIPARRIIALELIARGLVAIGVLALSAIPATAQDVPSPMELNRAGHWVQAAGVARQLLQEDGRPVIDRCVLRSQLIYALVRTGASAEASAEIRRFDRECGALPADHWARREVDALRGSLSPASGGTAKIARRDGWSVADPVALGLDTAALSAHRSLCERFGADACLVAYGGRIVQEWYGPRYREPMMAMSATKSVTGLLVGMVIADGALSLDDPVGRCIPEWRAGAKAGVQVRHLLTMTSGLPDDRTVSDVGRVRDKEAFVFGLELAADPGASWAYSNNGVFLLSPLLDRAAGEPIESYARRRLFQPLGMLGTRLHVYPEGQAWTHADMATTPRDLARIGQLMLDRGRWNGEQVVPETWVKASVTPSQAIQPHYGLLWWLDVPGGFAARGYLDTNLYVLPGHQLIVVRMQAAPVAGADRYEPLAFEFFEAIAHVPGSR